MLLCKPSGKNMSLELSLFPSVTPLPRNLENFLSMNLE